MSDAIADVLDDAADLIERDGWLQGDFTDDEGRHCFVHAVDMACLRRGLSYNETWRALGDENGWESSCWNDVTGRTEQQVLDRLRRMAKEQRS